MKRTYTLKRRAEQQAETRQRIVEAAFDLHSTVGPGLTTISMIAEQAGVQRHTVYAHFPDERSLFMACSGEVYERDPMPDARPWRAIGNSGERLRTGLTAIYGWYQRNAAVAGCVLRDAEYHALTREISALRMGPFAETYREVLGAKLNANQRALLALALSFFTWRTLTRDGGLKLGAAVDAMVEAIESAGEEASRAKSRS
jgi:AcrR family transcriptional regulator